VRKALESDVRGAESFIIAARDTVMRRSSHELMNETFPGVPVAADLSEHGTLLSIEKARRVLGYEARFTWRELF
jgi:UDP-glucose 4-epimerase